MLNLLVLLWYGVWYVGLGLLAIAALIALGVLLMWACIAFRTAWRELWSR